MSVTRSPRQLQAATYRRVDSNFLSRDVNRKLHPIFSQNQTIAVDPFSEEVDENADEKTMLRQLLKQNRHINTQLNTFVGNLSIINETCEQLQAENEDLRKENVKLYSEVRRNNLVISGLGETADEDTNKSKSIVQCFLESELGLQNIDIDTAFRMGKPKPDYIRKIHTFHKPSTPLVMKSFGLDLDEIVTILNKTKITGVKMWFKEILILMYADDIILLATTRGELQKQISCLKNFFGESELKVNLTKTKVVIFRKKVVPSTSQKTTFSQKPQVLVLNYFQFCVKVKQPTLMFT
ncbi:unnamed protein product [Allacma fusca]|uniref:Reverse transcriptase domain-containing protein n=1 Tax=Allacma fusca TaxID=39272 RepID=A0A8J2K6M3_9HEXA|nr:unnamed protein product [Allacma fusca]